MKNDLSGNRLQELERRFEYHKPINVNIETLHEDTRSLMLEVARFFVISIPDGREQSLAITKLEEAMFWANAAIARNHDKIG